MDKRKCKGSGMKAVAIGPANPEFPVCPICGKTNGTHKVGDVIKTHYIGTKSKAY